MEFTHTLRIYCYSVFGKQLGYDGHDEHIEIMTARIMGT